LPALAAVASVTLFLPAAGVAQPAPRVELTPYVGAFWPTRLLAREDFDVGGAREWKHEIAIATGARVNWWFSRRWGIEGSFAYAPSALNFSFGFDPWTPAEAAIVAGTLRGLVRFPVGSATTLHAGSGVGVLHRGGEGYELLGTMTDLSLVGAAGIRVSVSSALALRVDVEDYLSWVDGRTDRSGELDTRLQNDIVFSQGLAIALGGR
jgi:opacity protein-like surface antigen